MIMPYHKKLISSIGGGGRVRGVRFDGTFDNLIRSGDFTSNANSGVLTLSFWINSFTANRMEFMTLTGGRFVVEIDATSKLVVTGRNNSGTKVLEITSSNNTIEQSDGWVHVLAAANASTSEEYIYINDTADTNVTTPIGSGDVIDYTAEGHRISGNSGGLNLVNAEVAEVYFNNEEYVDISVTANRRKFISGSGKPVDLGSDGSLPTGSSPRVFLSLRDEETPSDFDTNKGTGGDYVSSSTLTEAATSPSD